MIVMETERFIERSTFPGSYYMMDGGINLDRTEFNQKD